MGRRQFSHLSKVEIRDIVTSFFGGKETKLEIAVRLTIDPATVAYHIRKYETAQLETESDPYAEVKRSFHPFCDHPSLKCSLCGRHKDAIHNENRVRIIALTKEVKGLKYNIERMKRRRSVTAFSRE